MDYGKQIKLCNTKFLYYEFYNTEKKDPLSSLCYFVPKYFHIHVAIA